MGHIFISYSRKDKDLVLPIYERLSRVYRLWMDMRDIDGGSSFDDVIRTNIRSASTLIAMISAQSVSSNWVSGEITEAQSHNIHVIPYVLDHTTSLPISLQSKNAFFAKHPNAEGKLMDSLALYAPDARVHPGKTMSVNEFSQHHRMTFAALGAQTMGQIITKQGNIGIPLKISRHHTAYLFANPKSTFEPPSLIQVGFQLTGALLGNDFVDSILRDMAALPGHEKPYLLVLRSPRKAKSPETQESDEGDQYSMNVQNPPEWSEVINLAYQIINEYFGKPRLELFIQGPAILLFQLGTKLRDLWPVDGYHFERGANPESGYFKVFSSP